MATIGVRRYIYFRLADIEGLPVTGRPQSVFSILFTRDNVVATDLLMITEIGAGRYFATYVPSACGADFIEMYDAANDIRVEDVEVIVPDVIAELESSIGSSLASGTVLLNQDYGGNGALRPSAANLSSFVLYAFLASDWQSGRTDTSYAAAAYQMDETGDWQFKLLPGVYNLVLMDTVGTVNVFQFNLAIALSSGS